VLKENCMETWRTEWIQEKNEIALKLAAGQCGGSYSEATIILCAALSALASSMWPRRRIDQVRFVQLLKDFAPTHLAVLGDVAGLFGLEKIVQSSRPHCYFPFDRVPRQLKGCVSQHSPVEIEMIRYLPFVLG
jgi:hypothetical protein